MSGSPGPLKVRSEWTKVLPSAKVNGCGCSEFITNGSPKRNRSTPHRRYRIRLQRTVRRSCRVRRDEHDSVPAVQVECKEYSREVALPEIEDLWSCGFG